MPKPQDFVVAFGLLQGEASTQSELASRVGLSQPEVSNALRRLQFSQLLRSDSRNVIVPNLIEACVHGVKYFIPPVLGNRRTGMATVALAPPLQGRVAGDDMELVWPMGSGPVRANSLEPIHPCAVHAAMQNKSVYELLVLLDGIRVGKARTAEIARNLFMERIRATEAHRAAG